MPGIAAIGILVFCAAMHVSASRPLDLELSRLEAEHAARRAAARSPARSGPQQLEALLRQLPREAQLTSQIAVLHQLARKQGIVLRHGSFELSAESHGRIARQQMTFQARTSYAALRHFMREALAAMPALALEDAALARAGESDQVDASLRFSLLLVRGEGA